MKVKYLVRENGKFAIKEEKFLPAIKTFDTEAEALNYLKNEFQNATEKFEVQVQQENGEFRAHEFETTSNETAEVVTPVVQPMPTPEVATPQAPAPDQTTVPTTPVTPEAAPAVQAVPTPEPAPAVVTTAPMPETTTATGVQAAEVTPAPETLNVESATPEADATTKTKFNVKDLWKNPEYRKWLYLGIAVFIEVAIIIAIIVLIAG